MISTEKIKSKKIFWILILFFSFILLALAIWHIVYRNNLITTLENDIKMARAKEEIRQKAELEEKQLQKRLAEEQEKERVAEFYKKTQLENLSSFLQKVANIGLSTEDVAIYLTVDDEPILFYREDEPMKAASSEKLPFLMALSEKIVNKELSLYQNWEVIPDDYEPSDGYVANQYPERTVFSIEELLDSVIVYSENIAFHAIERLVSRKRVYEMSQPVEYKKEYQGQNLMSPRIGHAIVTKLATDEKMAFLRERMKKAGYTYKLKENFGGIGKSGYYNGNLALLGMLPVDDGKIKFAIFAHNAEFAQMEELVDFIVKQAQEFAKNNP